MNDMHHYVTAISQIVSNENEEEVIVRGHRLSDLIRNASFVDSVFLLLRARMPSAGEKRSFDALLTACVDHAVTPPAMLGRAFASYGTSVPAALAAGMLTFGTILGGAGEALARAMIDAIGQTSQLDEAQLQAAARSIVENSLRDGGRVSGFGFPTHATDPRPPALLEVAQSSGVAGKYCALLLAMEAELSRRKGRRVPVNIDGIVAALVLDLELPPECASALVMIPRTFSTLAHHLEEKSQSTRWRHAPQSSVTYTGKLPNDR